MTGEEDDAITPPPEFPHGRLFGSDAIEDPSRPQSSSEAAHTTAPHPILTVDELAALLRVNRKTVYDALARGEIPGARRIRGRYRIHRDAVLRWLAEGQGRAPRSRGSR